MTGLSTSEDGLGSREALLAFRSFSGASVQWQTAYKVAILAISYGILGWFGLKLATPPGYASLVWPASGLAVAALLLGGRNLWPGVYLGSLGVNLAVGNMLDGSVNTMAVIANAGVIALGSTAQAVFAASAIKRRFGCPIRLRKFADVVTFAAISGPVSCLIAASAGVSVLWLSGTMPLRSIPHNWLVWWGGDVLGILAILPIALFTQWKEPKLIWRGNPVSPLTGSMALGLFLLIGATLLAWRVTSEITYERNLASFSGMAKDSEQALEHRIESYLQSLDGGAALIHASDHVSNSDWTNFVDEIDIGKLPGINGIGYIQPVKRGDEAAFLAQTRDDGVDGLEIHPASNRTEKFVITYIEPSATNLQAVGLDIAFEANRMSAAIEARDRGHAVITKRIFLVQDANRTPGFLLLRPVYAKGQPLITANERRKAFRGWVYAPFIASRFVNNLTASQDSGLTIDIYDGDKAVKSQRIFIGSKPDHDAAYMIQRTVPIMGQNWTIVWKSTPQFEKGTDSSEPFLVLFGGITLTLLFCLMLLAYARREVYVKEQVETKTRNLKQTMEALNQSERAFGDLAGLSPAGIIRTDPYGFCIYVNDCWLEMSGLEAFSALGIGWISAIHDEDREAFCSTWMVAIDEQVEHRATFRFAHAGGEYRWVDMISKPERSEDGTLRGFIAVAMDVTRNKEMEHDLKLARRSAEAAVEVKSRFLADMSHEIRTPMNGVIGFTELLLSGELADDQRRQIQLIADSGKAMMRLLNDILDLSKVDAGLMKVASEPVDLHHVVNSCITLMRSLAVEKQLDLRCEIDESVPHHIESDGLRLRQILLNLLGNALKFTSKGHVALRVHLDPQLDNRLVFDIADTGIGIAPERQAEIFDAFVQVEDQDTRSLGGTGLGLAISSKLARLMGGDLGLESKLGRGSLFRLTLPANVVEKAIDSTTRSERDSDRRRGARIPRCGNILLVEDHDINQLLMTDILHRLGMSVDIAGNGAEAVECVQQAAQTGPGYDLVLMDVRMPVMNGLDATRAIRAAGHDADRLPIVALTANGFADDIAACLDAGMQSHLTKPISVVELEGAIAKWSRPSSDRVSVSVELTPALPVKQSLQQRYAERKRQTIERLAEVVRRGSFAEAEISELGEMLHKLAGTAGMFGEAELGEQARAVEVDLKNWVAEGRTEQIAEALETLQNAA